MPLEARPHARHGSSPTLEHTVATSQKVVLLMITGGSLFVVVMLVQKWLEQNGRSKARDEALRELLGTPDERGEGTQSMPGSATAAGSFSTASGPESKSKIGGKKGKRVVSKSNDPPQSRSRSSSAASKPRSPGHQLNTLPVQQITSKLKALIPGLSASSSKTSKVVLAIEEPTQEEEPIMNKASDSVEPTSSELQAVETEADVQQATLSAAERKKLKKKQLRANRVRDKTLLGGSAESDGQDSPSPGGSTISLPSTSEQSTFTEQDASRNVQTLEPVSPRREKANPIQYKNTSEAESITPTATANTTPKVSMRSRMAGPQPVSMLRDESPTRRRSSASTEDNAEVYRDSIGSAPSLVGAFSPKSGRSRAESVVSLPPVTPLATNVGLNILDADLGVMKEDENAMAWQKVGKKEKAERKQKGKGRFDGESRMGPVSPPVSTASGTSSEFNLLMNMETRPAQSSTDASSASWISEAAPCPDCEQRKREENEKAVSPKTSTSAAEDDGSSRRILEMQQKLEDAVGEQKRQKAIIDSLTGTNINLSERLAELRDQRDKFESEVQAVREQLDGLRRELVTAKVATEQLDGLRRELGEAKDTIEELQSQAKQRQNQERANEDYKRKFENMLQKYETYRHNQTRVYDESSRNTARLETQIAEMSRIMERLQFQAYPGIMPPNPNAQYTLLPAPMMMPPPNAQGMTTGMVGQPPYQHNSYMLSSPPSVTFPGRDAGPRRVSPHQQPRPRYEGNPTSASGLAPNEMYSNQPTGMWALGSTNTTRPPHSPSRNADISTSILKPRRASTDLGAAAMGGGEGSGEGQVRIEGSSSAPEAPRAAMEDQSQGGNEMAGDQTVESQESTLRSLTTSVASRPTEPAVNGQTSTMRTPPRSEHDAALQERQLEFTFPRDSPSESVGNIANGSPAPTETDNTPVPSVPQHIAELETAEVMVQPEEDYDEPVFASIRPQER